MTETDLDLLGQFSREQSQEAFTALVNRHLNLVYSAAVRQVRSPQIAEEVCQTVFTKLARSAAELEPNTILTAWLYCVTRHAAIDAIRSETRRQAREQIAFQMSETNDPTADWRHIEPLLDEAMNSLDETDRAAILLRYFENKSLREVGETLGLSDDAAQKRVSRAVEELRKYFSSRKIAIAAGGIIAAVSANAVQAAPAALFSAVTAGAFIGAVSTSTAMSVTKAIAMTATQKTIIAIAAAGAIAAGIYQARQVSNLRSQVVELNDQLAKQSALTNQLEELRRERDLAKTQAASLLAENASAKKSPSEVLKLRGEVGRLRREKADIGSASALSKVTADPAATKMLRDQQKLGMSVIYKSFSKQMKLTPDQTDKLNDLLADHIMKDVGNVTTVLRDKTAPEQMAKIFSDENSALEDKVQSLLGADGLAQYQDYTKNIASSLTGEQIKNMLTGTDAEKADKSKQIAQIVKEEAQAALSNAGLPTDYQMVPMLNLMNIASTQSADQSVKLLDDIYQRTGVRASAFLSTEDQAKFQEFRTAAIENSKASISLNRSMMAPISN